VYSYDFTCIYRSDLACNIALEATATVAIEEDGRREIDIKRYAKVEKVKHFFKLMLVVQLTYIHMYYNLCLISKIVIE